MDNRTIEEIRNNETKLINDIKKIEEDLNEAKQNNQIMFETKCECIERANKYKGIIDEVKFYIGHLRNTKIIYSQEQIANYIDHMIIDFKLKEMD